MTNRMQLVLDSKTSKILNYCGGVSVSTTWDKYEPVIVGRSWSGATSEEDRYRDVRINYDSRQDLLSLKVEEYSYVSGGDTVVHYSEYYQDTTVADAEEALAGFPIRELTIGDFRVLSGIPNIDRVVARAVDLVVGGGLPTPHVDNFFAYLVYEISYSHRSRLYALLREINSDILKWVRLVDRL